MADRAGRLGPFGAPAPTSPRGAALIELVVVLPVFLGLLFAVFDFGSYFTDRMVITSAAYAGAGVRGQECGDTSHVGATVREAVRGMVSDWQAVEIAEQRRMGTASVRRYTLTVRYPRPTGPLSIFTSNLDLFDEIEATALALCDPGCDTCS